MMFNVDGLLLEEHSSVRATHTAAYSPASHQSLSLPSIRNLLPYIVIPGLSHDSKNTPCHDEEVAARNFGLEDMEPAGDREQQAPKKKRRRQALSCTECKRRKIKCDRAQPCGLCTRRGEQSECQWHVVEPMEKYVTRAEYDDLKAGVDNLHTFIYRVNPANLQHSKNTSRSSSAESSHDGRHSQNGELNDDPYCSYPALHDLRPSPNAPYQEFTALPRRFDSSPKPDSRTGHSHFSVALSTPSDSQTTLQPNSFWPPYYPLPSPAPMTAADHPAVPPPTLRRDERYPLDSSIPLSIRRMPCHITGVPMDAQLDPEESASMWSSRRRRRVCSKPDLLVAVLSLFLTLIGVVGTMLALRTTKSPDAGA